MDGWMIAQINWTDWIEGLNRLVGLDGWMDGLDRLITLQIDEWIATH